MNESERFEGTLLVVMALALFISAVFRLLWPKYYIWPDWVFSGLMILWMFGFVKWAVTGGIARQVRRGQ